MDIRLKVADNIIAHTLPISEDSRRKLAEILVRFDLSKNELFVAEGEICRYMGHVTRGMIRQFYIKKGRDVTEHFAYENRLFLCLESFIRQEPSHLIVEALEPVTLYGISHDTLHHLMNENPEICQLYCKILESSLIISQQKADARRFHSARERYARLSIEHPEIIKRASQIHIASMLEMSPETLSRIRAELL